MKKAETEKTKVLKPLEPPDRKRCQAEIPNGVNFMTLGGRFERVRCKSAPTVIVTEVQPGKDGRHGSMALCHLCWAQALKQLGAWSISAEPIIEPSETDVDEPLPEDAAIVARREGYAAGQIEALEHAIREAEVEAGPSASRGSSGSSSDFLAGWRRGASEVGIRLHELLRTVRGRAAKFADGSAGHG